MHKSSGVVTCDTLKVIDTETDHQMSSLVNVEEGGGRSERGEEEGERGEREGEEEGGVCDQGWQEAPSSPSAADVLYSRIRELSVQIKQELGTFDSLSDSGTPPPPPPPLLLVASDGGSVRMEENGSPQSPIQSMRESEGHLEQNGTTKLDIDPTNNDVLVHVPVSQHTPPTDNECLQVGKGVLSAIPVTAKQDASSLANQQQCSNETPVSSQYSASYNNNTVPQQSHHQKGRGGEGPGNNAQRLPVRGECAGAGEEEEDGTGVSEGDASGGGKTGGGGDGGKHEGGRGDGEGGKGEGGRSGGEGGRGDGGGPGRPKASKKGVILDPDLMRAIEKMKKLDARLADLAKVRVHVHVHVSRCTCTYMCVCVCCYLCVVLLHVFIHNTHVFVQIIRKPASLHLPSLLPLPSFPFTGLQKEQELKQQRKLLEQQMSASEVSSSVGVDGEATASPSASSGVFVALETGVFTCTDYCGHHCMDQGNVSSLY